MKIFKKVLPAWPLSTLLLALCLALVTSCSTNKGASGKIHVMGEASGAGGLMYTVTEAEWKEALDGPMGARLPKHRFLLITVNVLNNSAAEVNVPLLSLLNPSGAAFREESQGDGVMPWLGLLRRVQPGETLSGKILFDVAPASYNLRISSGGDADTEVTAIVEIPYRADPPPVKPVDTLPAPATK